MSLFWHQVRSRDQRGKYVCISLFVPACIYLFGDGGCVKNSFLCFVLRSKIEMQSFAKNNVYLYIQRWGPQFTLVTHHVSIFHKICLGFLLVLCFNFLCHCRFWVDDSFSIKSLCKVRITIIQQIQTNLSLPWWNTTFRLQWLGRGTSKTR